MLTVAFQEACTRLGNGKPNASGYTKKVRRSLLRFRMVTAFLALKNDTAGAG